MSKEIITIILSSIAITAAIISILNYFRRILSNPIEEDKRIKIKHSLILIFVILIVTTFLYLEFGSIVFPAPTITPEPKTLVDISGSYSGYFTNELGKKIPTYLIVSNIESSDSIKLTFKNTNTLFYDALYLKEDKILIVNNLGKSYIKEENESIIITSQENLANKWEFIKNK